MHSCAADRSLNGCCIRGENAGDAYPNHRYALGSGRETSAVYPTDSPTYSRGEPEDRSVNKIFERGTIRSAPQTQPGSTMQP